MTRRDGARTIRNMEQFAAASGFSRPTVSKYFHDPSSVRASTRAGIEAAIERYDYRPNLFAMNQNRRLTKNVGVVVPLLTDPFFAEIARTIERLCVAAGFRPILLSSNGETAQEAENLDTLLSLKPAGVLLAPLGRSSDREALTAFCRDVPTVLFDSNVEGLGEAFVGSDNASFIAQTVGYLCDTGEPPFFFEMRHPANPNANKRRAAFVAEMDARGIEPGIHKIDGTGWAFEEIGRRGALAMIDAGAMPGRTILCSNDRLAIGVLAACYERGLRVGKGTGCALRLASNDDHPHARYTCPALTTAAHDYGSVAARAVETLFALIEAGGRFESRQETLFAARLILRDSA